MPVWFEQQQKQSSKKSTTVKCKTGQRKVCSDGFVCKQGRCVLEDPNILPSLSDMKLNTKLNTILTGMVLDGDMTDRQRKNILKMRFFRSLVSPLTQGKMSVNEYVQAVRKEQQRLAQQRRRLLQQQEQYYWKEKTCCQNWNYCFRSSCFKEQRSNNFVCHCVFTEIKMSSSNKNNNKWITETKKASVLHGKSYSDMLKDKDHRINYHRNQCDPTKMHRGGNLLPLHHPAMTPNNIPPIGHATPTPAYLQERAKMIAVSKQNTINYLKALRKK